MVKRIAIVGGGLLLLMTLLVGGTNVGSYAMTAFKGLRNRVDDSVPLDFKLSDAREQLTRLAPEINQMKYEFARQEIQVSRLREDVESSQANLDEQLANIVRLKSHLDSGETAFVSRGRSYSTEEVEMDLKRRWELYKTSESVIETKHEVLVAQEAGLNAARQQIAETEAQREQLELEIAQLEARLRRVEVAKTASELNFDDSRLAHLRSSIDDIRSRIQVEEHMLNTTEAQDFNGIPLDEETVSEDVRSEIDTYLSNRSVSTVQ